MSGKLLLQRGLEKWILQESLVVRQLMLHDISKKHNENFIHFAC